MRRLSEKTLVNKALSLGLDLNVRLEKAAPLQPMSRKMIVKAIVSEMGAKHPGNWDHTLNNFSIQKNKSSIFCPTSKVHDPYLGRPESFHLADSKSSWMIIHANEPIRDKVHSYQAHTRTE